MGRKAKKQSGGGDGGGDSFTVLFTTLSLILLAFFIFMKTLSTIEEDSARRALASIRRNFELMSLGGLYQLFDDDHQGVFIVPDQVRFRDLEQDLQDIVVRQQLGESNDLTVQQNDREIRIRISEQVLFGPNVVALNPRTFPLLDRVGAFLAEIGAETVVEGHCDPAGGERNWELSSLRAAAVARFLDESADFEEQLLRSRGLAHYHSESIAPDRARRVEIVVPRPRGAS